MYLPPSSASDSVSADAFELTPFFSWTFLLIPEKSCISKTVFICISLDFFSWIISDSIVSFDFSSYNSRTISRISCSCLGFFSLTWPFFSVTPLEQLSLAEFRDEKTWPQLQLGVYKKILGLWFFLVLKVKSRAILIFKVLFLFQKSTESF